MSEKERKQVPELERSTGAMSGKEAPKFETISNFTLREALCDDSIPPAERDIIAGIRLAVKESKEQRQAKLAEAQRPGSQQRHTGHAPEPLTWKTNDALTLQELEVSTIKASTGKMQFEIKLRTLCHSRGAVRDDLDLSERLATRQVVLILGDLGQVTIPWAQMLQPAAHLYRKGFTVMFVDVPLLVTDSMRYMKYGPELLLGLLRFLKVPKVNVLARGVGGAVFIKALTWAPERFCKMHMVYNMDFPKSANALFPGATLMSILSHNLIQIWFTYCDDEFCNRSDPTSSAQAVYSQLATLQGKLRLERKVNKVHRAYDEVVFTENLNPNAQTCFVNETKVGVHSSTLFSKELLKSMERFIVSVPSADQDSLKATRGIIVGTGNEHAPLLDRKLNSAKGDLVALRRLKQGPDNDTRCETNRANHRRLSRVAQALATMQSIEDVRDLQPAYSPSTYSPSGSNTPFYTSSGAFTSPAMSRRTSISSLPGYASCASTTDTTPLALEGPSCTQMLDDIAVVNYAFSSSNSACGYEEPVSPTSIEDGCCFEAIVVSKKTFDSKELPDFNSMSRQTTAASSSPDFSSSPFPRQSPDTSGSNWSEAMDSSPGYRALTAEQAARKRYEKNIMMAIDQLDAEVMRPPSAHDPRPATPGSSLPKLLNAGPIVRFETDSCSSHSTSSSTIGLLGPMKKGTRPHSGLLSRTTAEDVAQGLPGFSLAKSDVDIPEDWAQPPAAKLTRPSSCGMISRGADKTSLAMPRIASQSRIAPADECMKRPARLKSAVGAVAGLFTMYGGRKG